LFAFGFRKNILSQERAGIYYAFMNNEQTDGLGHTDGARANGMPACDDQHQFKNKRKQLAKHRW